MTKRFFVFSEMGFAGIITVLDNGLYNNELGQVFNETDKILLDQFSKSPQSSHFDRSYQSSEYTQCSGTLDPDTATKYLPVFKANPIILNTFSIESYGSITIKHNNERLTFLLFVCTLKDPIEESLKCIKYSFGLQHIDTGLFVTESGLIKTVSRVVSDTTGVPTVEELYNDTTESIPWLAYIPLEKFKVVAFPTVDTGAI